MAGNQEVFDKAIMEGDGYAWEQQWPQAIEAYMTAVREMPQNADAYNSLGYAFFQAGRLDDALKIYIQAAKLSPSDPLPVERTADVLERLGRLNDAAKQYVAVAELYLAQHDLVKAISSWEKVTHITPGLVKVHHKLAQAYERNGQKEEAVSEYLKLAYNFQQGNNLDMATKAVERAYRLAPKDPDVLNAMTALRSGTPLSPLGKKELSHKGSSEAADLLEEYASEYGIDYANVGDADERGPIGDAIESALEQLAAHVFESGMMDMSGAFTIQAIEMHRAGITDDAITLYRQALDSGMSFSGPVNMNLGALYLEKENWKDALQYLQQASGDNVMMAGASHGISQAYIGQKDWRKAAKSLVNTLRMADMSLATSEEAIANLGGVYSRLGKMVDSASDATLEALSQKLARMVTGVDWKRRVAHTRNQIEDITKNPEGGLADLAQDDGVIDAMGRIDDFMQQRRFNLAMDEAHQVILKSPDYLAAHLRVAQIMMDMGQIEKAIVKYNLIAQTYLARGDEQKTSEVLNEVIKIAPSDIRLRENLIELLEKQERWGEVIDQYIDLASAYRDLADMGAARTTYDQAVKMAQRLNAPQQKILSIMHQLAQVDEERLDLRGALRTYQRIIEMNAEDETARLHVVDIYYRLNNPAAGIQELDKLLQLYAKQRRPDMILQVLEAQAEDFPNDMGLRSRLGAVYQNMGRVPKAVEQFEALRQLQADAGLHDDAKKTIKRIISLNPPKVAHYQQLLQQLGG